MLVKVKVQFKFSDGSTAWLTSCFDKSKAISWRMDELKDWEEISTFPLNGFYKSK